MIDGSHKDNCTHEWESRVHMGEHHSDQWYECRKCHRIAKSEAVEKLRTSCRHNWMIQAGRLSGDDDKYYYRCRTCSATATEKGLKTEAVKKLLPLGAVEGLALPVLVERAYFNALSRQGCKFVYITVSLGADGTDRRADEHIKAASAANLKIGLCHSFHPKDAPDLQAKNFLEKLNMKHWDLPLMIDCKEFGSIPDDYADKLHKTASEIQRQIRMIPVLYTQTDFARQHLDSRFVVFPVAIEKSVETLGTHNKPELPDWWTDFLFWHYDSPGPYTERVHRFVYNGNSEAFSQLCEHPHLER